MGKFAAILMLGLLCLATYSNSLRNPFLMDDHALILDNPYIADISHLQLNIFSPGSGTAHGENYIYFRPITHLADYISYRLYGYDVYGYHLMNLCLFFMSSIIWLLLLKLIFPQGPAPLLATVFYISHPIFGVLVNYTSTTGYILLIIFILLGFTLHLRYVESQQNAWFIGSVVCFCLSLLCHETAAGFPLYLAGILYFMKRHSLRKTLLQMIPYFAVIGLYLLFRTHYASLKSGVIDNIGGFNLGPLEYIAMLFQLVFSYLKNLIFLQDIVLIYSAPGSDVSLLKNLLFGTGILTLGIGLFSYWKRDPKAMVVWWIIVGFGPVTLACFSRPSMGLIISPHWLLIPSVGYCLFIALLFTALISSSKRKLGVGLALFTLIAFVSVSRYYNRLWGNEIRYCHYMLRLSPNIPLAKFWLAHAYAAEEQWEPARKYFKETIMGVENDWKGYSNLGVIEGQLGNSEEEIRYYYKALRLKPDSPEIWNNLAAVYIDRGEHAKAVTILKRILRKYPDFTPAQANINRISKSTSD